MPSKEGLLISLQPVLSTNDYRSEKAFEMAAQRAINKAREIITIQEKNYDSLPKVYLFPEAIGSFLFACGESDFIFKYGLRAQLSKSGRDVESSESSLELIYTNVFSKLAKENNCYIVAGSTFIMNTSFSEEKKQAILGKEGLYNICLTFDPQGKVINLTRKCHLTPEESYIDEGKISQLKVCETTLGKLGILICADSWHPKGYEELERQKVDIIAVPSFNAPAGDWTKPWRGYTINSKPEFDESDINKSREGQMWGKYGLQGKIKKTSAKAGLNSFAHGKVWDLEPGGQSCAIYEGDVSQSPEFEDYESAIYKKISLL